MIPDNGQLLSNAFEQLPEGLIIVNASDETGLVRQGGKDGCPLFRWNYTALVMIPFEYHGGRGHDATVLGRFCKFLVAVERIRVAQSNGETPTHALFDFKHIHEGNLASDEPPQNRCQA